VRKTSDDESASPSTDAPADRLLTIEQVKERLQVSHETVYRLMRQGKLRSTKIGRARRVKESALTAYIRSLPDLPLR